MRFEIGYFFLEIGFGLDPISRKKYLISNLIIYFHFPRACVRQYTVRATPSVFYYIGDPYTSLFLHTFQGGGGSKPIINSIIYQGNKNKRALTICYGATVGPELSSSGPPTLRLHVGSEAYRSSNIVRKFGPQLYKSGPGPKYYRRTGLLYIITLVAYTLF